MDNQTILSIRDLRVVFEDGFTALGGRSEEHTSELQSPC